MYTSADKRRQQDRLSDMGRHSGNVGRRPQYHQLRTESDSFKDDEQAQLGRATDAFDDADASDGEEGFGDIPTATGDELAAAAKRELDASSRQIEGLVFKAVAEQIGKKPSQVAYVIQQLKFHNATIPFLARYRRDSTGNMDEATLLLLKESVEERIDVFRRRKNMIKSLHERKLLTRPLLVALKRCTTINALEDVYDPFRTKRNTLAESALEAGLGPLCDRLLKSLPADEHAEFELAQDVATLSKRVPHGEKLAVALMAQTIHQCEVAREVTDRLVRLKGHLVSEINSTRRRAAAREMPDKVWESEVQHYRPYSQYSVPLRHATATAVLAIQRGEREGLLKVDVSLPSNVSKTVAKIIVKRFPGFQRLRGSQRPVQPSHQTSTKKGSRVAKELTTPSDLLQRALQEAVGVLLVKQACSAARRDLKELAERESCAVFARNFRKMLLQRPMPLRVLAMDPGYIHGIKCVILDEFMNPQLKFVINLKEPEKIQKAIKLCYEKHQIRHILIGNRTASRETEQAVATAIQKQGLTELSYALVSENGASVYSTSVIAKDEFPSLDPMYRGAISIGRRVQDPLSELVKIPVQSLGIGLYQHEIPIKRLMAELRTTVQGCVSFVGVSVDTASKYVLQSVPGLPPKVANAIHHNREKIKCREDLRRIPGMTEGMFTAVAGFLRVMRSPEPLDRTIIHPEHYGASRALLSYFRVDFSSRELVAARLKEAVAAEARVLRAGRDGTDDGPGLMETATRRVLSSLAATIGIRPGSLIVLLKGLAQQVLDPRESLKYQNLFRHSATNPGELKDGQLVDGVVENVTPFGLFIDIGVGTNLMMPASRATKDIGPGDIIEDMLVCRRASESDPAKAMHLSLAKASVRNAQEFASFREGDIYAAMIQEVRKMRAEMFPETLSNEWLSGLDSSTRAALERWK